VILIGLEARTFLKRWTVLTELALLSLSWLVELVSSIVEWYVRLRPANIIDEIDTVHKIFLRTDYCV
jgi:hypothetical protein